MTDTIFKSNNHQQDQWLAIITIVISWQEPTSSPLGITVSTTKTKLITCYSPFCWLNDSHMLSHSLNDSPSIHLFSLHNKQTYLLPNQGTLNEIRHHEFTPQEIPASWEAHVFVPPATWFFPTIDGNSNWVSTCHGQCLQGWLMINRNGFVWSQPRLQPKS